MRFFSAMRGNIPSSLSLQLMSVSLLTNTFQDYKSGKLPVFPVEVSAAAIADAPAGLLCTSTG